MLALFEQYPLLKEKIPYIPLGDFPTPVEKLERLGQAIHAPQLYIKREDLSGKRRKNEQSQSSVCTTSDT